MFLKLAWLLNLLVLCRPEVYVEHTYGLDKLYALHTPQATLMIGSLKIDTTRLPVRIEEDELSLDKELVGIVHNTDREHDLKVMRMYWNLLDYPYLAPKR